MAKVIMQLYWEVYSSFVTSSVLSKHSEQIFSSKLLFRTTSRIIKLKIKILWLENMHAMFYEFFLKLVVPKRQAKSLKIICNYFVSFADCRAEIVWKTTISQVFIKSLAKLVYQPLVCGIVKNLIIEAFAYFYHHLNITNLPLYYEILGAAFC